MHGISWPREAPQLARGILPFGYGGLALIAWLVLSVLAFGLGQIYVDTVRTDRKEDALARASVGVEALQQVFLRSIGVMENIQSLVQIRENLLLTGNTEGAEAVASHIRSITTEEEFGVVQVSTIGPDGWMNWSSIVGAQPVWLGDREHFLVHVHEDRGVYVSKPLIGRVSKRWSMQFTRRLATSDGKFRGVAVVSFDPLHLSRTMASLGFGANYVSAIWTIPDGQLVARSRDAADLLSRAPNPKVPAVVAARQSDAGKLDILSPIDGRRRFQAYRVLDQLPFVATVSLDAAEALREDDMLSTWVFLAAGALTLFAGALLALLAMSSARRRSALQLQLVRKEAEITELARQRIAELLSGLPAAVYGANLATDGSVLSFTITDTAHRLTGWEIGDITSREQWENKAKGLSNTDWHAYLDKIIQDGDAAIEYSFIRADGTAAWLRDQARVVRRDDSGVWVVGYVSDITRERTMQAQAFATSKLATLGEMATGLAHELNQPIATMALAAENAAMALETKREDGIPFALARIQRIVNQAARARTIINHLRIFGRQTNDETGPVSLRAVVDGALTLVESALRNSGIAVDVRVDENLPPVLAQLVLAEHVMVNLILNARDAMDTNPPERPRRLTIAAQYDADAEKVRLMVQDTGPGVPEGLLDRVFEPFFTTKEVGKGTGLGLSLCHGLMNSFNGKIEVQNGPEGGAIFTATFGRAVEKIEADGDAAERRVAAPAWA